MSSPSVVPEVSHSPSKSSWVSAPKRKNAPPFVPEGPNPPPVFHEKKQLLEESSASTLLLPSSQTFTPFPLLEHTWFHFILPLFLTGVDVGRLTSTCHEMNRLIQSNPIFWINLRRFMEISRNRVHTYAEGNKKTIPFLTSEDDASQIDEVILQWSLRQRMHSYHTHVSHLHVIDVQLHDSPDHRNIYTPAFLTSPHSPFGNLLELCIEAKYTANPWLVHPHRLKKLTLRYMEDATQVPHAQWWPDSLTSLLTLDIHYNGDIEPEIYARLHPWHQAWNQPTVSTLLSIHNHGLPLPIPWMSPHNLQKLIINVHEEKQSDEMFSWTNRCFQDMASRPQTCFVLHVRLTTPEMVQKWASIGTPWKVHRRPLQLIMSWGGNFLGLILQTHTRSEAHFYINSAPKKDAYPILTALETSAWMDYIHTSEVVRYDNRYPSPSPTWFSDTSSRLTCNTLHVRETFPSTAFMCGLTLPPKLTILHLNISEINSSTALWTTPAPQITQLTLNFVHPIKEDHMSHVLTWIAQLLSHVPHLRSFCCFADGVLDDSIYELTDLSPLHARCWDAFPRTLESLHLDGDVLPYPLTIDPEDKTIVRRPFNSTLGHFFKLQMVHNEPQCISRPHVLGTEGWIRRHTPAPCQCAPPEVLNSLQEWKSSSMKKMVETFPNLYILGGLHQPQLQLSFVDDQKWRATQCARVQHLFHQPGFTFLEER